MNKFLSILIIILLTCSTAAAEEKIPVKIVPAENISTVYDDVQLGDRLLFKVKNDVYCGKTLIFKKDTTVLGYVSFLNENGWTNDNAEIQMNEFRLKDTEGKLIEIKSEVTLNGFELLKTKGKRIAQFFNYIGVIARGKEVDIRYKKDKPEFTVWYVK